MSNKVLTWALEQETGSPTRKLVLLKLADQANDNGYCWPSKETIARHCEVHKKTVQKLIAELEGLGYLSIQHRRDGTTNLSNAYYLHWGVGAQDSQGGLQHSQGWEHTTPRVGAQDSPEPSEEPSNTNPHPMNGKGGSLSDRFEEWWQHYPKKRAKAECQKKWRRKGLHKRADELIADVQKRKAQDAQWVRGYAPYPLTYLNQERWEDEIEPPKDNGDSQPDPFENAL